MAVLFSIKQDTGWWNKRAETMPREELDKFHLQRLQQLVQYVYKYTPFYRKKFDEIGLKPEDIKSLEDYKRKVPLTDKSDFRPLQDQNPHYGETGSLPEQFLTHHAETSGTTGAPLRIPYTQLDTIRYGESWAYGFWAIGIRPSDSFYFAFNWGLFAGFWSAFWGVQRLGGKIYSGGGQNTEGHIKQILRLKPSVLIATPTYAIHIAERAREQGIDLAESSVKYVYTAGEPGACGIPAMREQLDELWGATSCELMGLAEVDALAPGCPTREGVHVNEMNVFSWSMDPETCEEVPEGEVGENILTSYSNGAQPLLNYRSHDMVRRYKSCSCGRTWDFLKGSVLGRSDYMITVRGTNVYQTAVEETIRRIPGVSSHYILELTREKGLDQMTVKFEPDFSVKEKDYEQIKANVEQAIKETLKVRLTAEIVPAESLPRSELKTKRIVDKRSVDVRRELDKN